MGARSVNGKLRIESLSCLSSLESLFALKSQIQRWRFERPVISHAIIQAKCALYFLSPSNSRGNRINCAANIILTADSSRIGVADETVTLLSRIQIRLAHSREQVNSLIVRLLGILINSISLVQRE